MAGPRLVGKASDRREAILNAARLLFAERGYDATSIGDIIARAEISRGGFYHYFSAKEDLIEALALRYAADSARQVEKAIADPTMDAFSRLTAFFRAVRQRKVDDAEDLRRTFAPLLRPENAQLHERTQFAVLENVRPMLVHILCDGVADQTFDTPNPEAAADLIMHMLSSNRPLVIAMYEAGDKHTFERLSEQLVTRLQYLATVIDRILGLPEGSLDFVDPEAVQIIRRLADNTPDAA